MHRITDISSSETNTHRILFRSHYRSQKWEDLGRKSAHCLIAKSNQEVIDHGCTGKEFWFASPASVSDRGVSLFRAHAKLGFAINQAYY